MPGTEYRRKTAFNRILTPFTELFGFSRGLAVLAVLMITTVMLTGVFWFFHSAPPDTITITSGAPGSSFQVNAEKYKAILARNHVTLKILPSAGSLENLQRLEDPASGVDVGFVQGGLTNGTNIPKLVSLGSISYQPLLVFYRSESPMTLLSGLKGRRVAVGAVGSGTRALALGLLELNGIQPGGATTLSDLDADDAAKALVDGKVDAVFLMGDSASPQVMRKLLLTPEIRLFDFTQADGYTRRISYLTKLELPEGSVDFGSNIPSQDVRLVGPTVELLARPSLHPALSDLLLEAAREVHGGPSLMRKRGEFPAPIEHDYPISADATRFYKSGKSFLYRTLPFWLATLVNRMLVAFVPVVVVLVPGLRMIPALYRWRLKLLIYRWYRALLRVERELLIPVQTEQHAELVERVGEIETAVNRMKVPASFAEQFYVLRQHIDYVRARLTTGAKGH